MYNGSIEIEIGKALVPVEDDNASCFNCCLFVKDGCKGVFACGPSKRQDGKHVVFNLVDYKEQEDEPHV